MDQNKNDEKFENFHKSSNVLDKDVRLRILNDRSLKNENNRKKKYWTISYSCALDITSTIFLSIFIYSFYFFYFRQFHFCDLWLSHWKAAWSEQIISTTIKRAGKRVLKASKNTEKNEFNTIWNCFDMFLWFFIKRKKSLLKLV